MHKYRKIGYFTYGFGLAASQMTATLPFTTLKLAAVTGTIYQLHGLTKEYYSKVKNAE